MSLRRLAIVAIVAICIVVPAIEMFDRWDHTLEDGNDTEANVVIVALCVGLAFAIGTVAVIDRLRALSARPRRETIDVRPVRMSASPLAPPTPTISPPIPLRI